MFRHLQCICPAARRAIRERDIGVSKVAIELQKRRSEHSLQSAALLAVSVISRSWMEDMSGGWVGRREERGRLRLYGRINLVFMG